MLWEKIRRHDTDAAQQQALAAQLLGLVKGHVADLAGSPTASRVIQVHLTPGRRHLNCTGDPVTFLYLCL